MSQVKQALEGAIELLTRFYESPSLAHARAIPMIDNELPSLRAALEALDAEEKGVVEWRATARVAIGHLQAVLNKARTHADQQAADTTARDWLTSIGSEPN